MYNPVKVVEVFLWGHRVGALAHDYDRYSVFEYDSEFRRLGIEIAPFMMPLSQAVYYAEDFHLPRTMFSGLPGNNYENTPLQCLDAGECVRHLGWSMSGGPWITHETAQRKIARRKCAA